MTQNDTPNRPRVFIVMPAYNAEQTLEATLRDIPEGCYDEILVGDDCSSDGTVALSEKLGLTTLVTPKNLGYGGNQKMLYRAALERGADIVVMLHPDNQYDATLVPHFVGFIQNGVCDVILGNRIRSRREALGGGMPAWKYFNNRLLTIFLNLVYGQNLGEFHSGFRAYRREVLEKVAFERNVDAFGFDAQFLAQAIWFGFKVADAPMPVRYFKEASSIRFWPSVRYGLENLRVATAFLCRKLGIRQALFEPSSRDSSTT
ncbi:MAG: glycosyltransferase family 2 protein [Planctomycetota bacterium]|nr:glycosyltransferase family 2 protein [Planctomycetota bacterium]MDA0932443.1 glycosyltransferase family 2 protein [Planctomycetota bacterium]MDA1222925.1 glycosyltransferase family 2 protein [Planctomycetota bacterium]